MVPKTGGWEEQNNPGAPTVAGEGEIAVVELGLCLGTHCIYGGTRVGYTQKRSSWCARNK